MEDEEDKVGLGRVGTVWFGSGLLGLDLKASLAKNHQCKPPINN